MANKNWRFWHHTVTVNNFGVILPLNKSFCSHNHFTTCCSCTRSNFFEIDCTHFRSNLPIQRVCSQLIGNLQSIQNCFLKGIKCICTTNYICCINCLCLTSVNIGHTEFNTIIRFFHKTYDYSTIFECQRFIFNLLTGCFTLC